MFSTKRARHRFEDIVFHIERVDLLHFLEHPNPERYGRQLIFVVEPEECA